MAFDREQFKQEFYFHTYRKQDEEEDLENDCKALTCDLFDINIGPVNGDVLEITIPKKYLSGINGDNLMFAIEVGKAEKNELNARWDNVFLEGIYHDSLKG